MVVLPKPLVFKWDTGNIDKNVEKHAVTNREAEELLKNEQVVYFRNERQSYTEIRHGVYGKTNTGRLLTIIFTIRGDSVRIISARDMSRKERRVYGQKTQTNTKI